MIFEFGHQKVDIDVERTRQFYLEDGILDCPCDDCVNYVNAVDKLPEPVKSFFDNIGVNIKNPAEISTLCAVSEKTVVYHGFYYVCGNVLDNDNLGEEFDEDDESYYAIAPHFWAYFLRKLALPEDTLPEPLVWLEFTGRIPWVLDKPCLHPIEHIND